MRLLLLLGLPGLLQSAQMQTESSLLKTLLEQVNRGKREKLGGVDLHGDQFCVDISSFGPIEWVEEDGYEVCETPFVKKCEDKSENVCADVMETKCEVVPYTECTMGVVPIEFTKTEFSPKQFEPQECKTTQDTIPHRKMVPECRDVTKQNCVTLWETDADGNQVWAGKEACEPVTWQECKLVPKDVQFIVPKVECTPTDPIWYHIPQKVEDTRDTNTMTCVVKSTTHCEAVSRPDCKYVTYQECKEVPMESCQPKDVHRPTQEKIHRKKCLLPDDPTPAPDTYGSPEAPPVELPSYQAQFK